MPPSLQEEAKGGRVTGTGTHVHPNIIQFLIIHHACSKLRLRSTSRILFHAK